MIGHSSGVVFDPTRHCHTTRPFPSAIFGPRPLALEGHGKGWPSDWWLAESQIEADNYKDAFKVFQRDLNRVVPRISLISQTYIDFFRQPFLIVKDGGRVGSARVLITSSGSC